MSAEVVNVQTVKQEEIYLKRHEEVKQLWPGLEWYFDFFNERRRHQSLDYRTPAEVYRQGR